MKIDIIGNHWDEILDVMLVSKDLEQAVLFTPETEFKKVVKELKTKYPKLKQVNFFHYYKVRIRPKSEEYKLVFYKNITIWVSDENIVKI